MTAEAPRPATEVGFYHLTRQPLDAVLPRLLEKAHAAGYRILVHCADAAQVKALDQHLWTYDDASFLPHGCDAPADQPILLATSAADPANRADVLAAIDTLDGERLGQYRRVLYLFEESDGARLQAARRSWSALKADATVTRTYWQQDDRGRWIKKQ